MEFLLFTLLLVLALYLAFRVHSNSKKIDLHLIEKEVEEDFKAEFIDTSVGRIPGDGMLALVEWCEDDMRERKLSKSKQIESFDVL